MPARPDRAPSPARRASASRVRRSRPGINLGQRKPSCTAATTSRAEVVVDLHPGHNTEPGEGILDLETASGAPCRWP